MQSIPFYQAWVMQKSDLTSCVPAKYSHRGFISTQVYIASG